MTEKVKAIADFFIRVIMMFTTVVSLLYFSGIYNQTLFTILSLVFLTALIVKGVCSVLVAGKKK